MNARLRMRLLRPRQSAPIGTLSLVGGIVDSFDSCDALRSHELPSSYRLKSRVQYARTMRRLGAGLLLAAALCALVALSFPSSPSTPSPAATLSASGQGGLPFYSQERAP